MQSVDSAWSEYLEWVGVIREGIHLRRYSGRTPFLEFVEAASDEYERLAGRAILQATERFEQWASSGRAAREDLVRPASTWTYLISDNPFKQFSLAGLAGGDIMAAVSTVLYSPFLAFEVVLKWLRGRRR